MNEFIPLDHFYRIVRLWWLIVVTMLAGSLAGYLFHRLRPPLYEVTATYLVQVDLNKMPVLDIPLDQFQYTLDLAVTTTESVIKSPILLELVVAEAARQGIQTDVVALLKNSTVERRLDFWYLHYRHPDPQIAQATLEIWAGMAYQSMLDLQGIGNIVNYVIFGAPEFQPTPSEPVVYQRNQLMLAGLLLGAVAGFFLADVLALKWPTAA
jgi:uncharacterized protein involved in exopolysaccharide biosynthesis